MNIIVIAKLSDYKLSTTLPPLANIDFVKNIYLVRRTPLEGEKIKCYCPPTFLRASKFASEIYRILTLFYLCLFKKVNCLIGMYFYYHCVYAAFFGLLFRKPYMFSIVEEAKLYFEDKRFDRVSAKADAIAVRGNHSRQFLIEKKGLLPHNVFILPDYFSWRNPRPQMKKDYDFVYVGGLVQDKRVDVLVDVVAKVKESLPHVRFAIIGQGPCESLVREKISQLKVEGNIDLLGFVDDIYLYLNRSKVFIMTSETEGLPTVLLEAMDANLPFIVPDVGDVADLAQDHQNALVVPRLDVEAFARACVRMLSDDEFYQKISENARLIKEQRKNDFSMEKVSKIWCNVLTKCS